ncbi:MAG: response regulator, partial [Okeania sp. SIO2D1]|nr:response regulator [Okeania sp. SIO2D1]
MNRPVIICVDDEPTILESLEIELTTALGDQYMIETAEGGQEALELFTELVAENCEVALVMSDYIMPDIKGDELLKRIHELSPKTLKIMLTGQADLQAVSDAIKYAKLYRYIPKPWQPEDLKLTTLEAIHSYIQDKKLEEQDQKLEQVNQDLEKLNYQQAKLIAQLHENEYRLTQFLEAMPVGVGVIDSSGKPYYLNRKAKELFGKGAMPEVSLEQLSEVYQIYQAGTRNIYPPHKLPIVQALQGITVTADDLEVKQGKKVIPLEVWATPIYDEKGDIVYAINTLQDITERAKAEIARSKFNQELLALNFANERFVPRQFLKLLNKSSIVEVELGHSVEQEMSILFADIRDFTILSEGMTPEDNFKFINGYFSHM